MFQVNQSAACASAAPTPSCAQSAAGPTSRCARGATALAVELDRGRAVGVRVAGRSGRSELLRAEREVILCAGAIGSPQLLQLSGIGAPGDLRAVGIDVLHELPGVGRNLQDHPFVTVLSEISDENTLYGADKPKPLAEWVLRRTGPLSSTVAEVVAFHRTRPGLPAADIQFHMGAAYFEDHGAELYDGHCMTIGPVLVSPRARGRVWLRSADPTAKPRILTNSLSEPEDMASLVAGVRARARVRRAAGRCARSSSRSSSRARTSVGRADIEADHPAAAHAHLPPGRHLPHERHRGGAVVDSRLRVHGIDGLRVADASIMPTIVGGNTHAPTVMIAERAADLIAPP